MVVTPFIGIASGQKSKKLVKITSGWNPKAGKDFNCAFVSFRRRSFRRVSRTQRISIRVDEVGARRACSKGGSSDLKAERPRRGFCAWFKTGPGTVAGFFHMDIHDRWAGGLRLHGRRRARCPVITADNHDPSPAVSAPFHAWRLRAGVSGPGSKRGQAPLCKAPFGPFRQRSQTPF
jgi:hypothetical protein